MITAIIRARNPSTGPMRDGAPTYEKGVPKIFVLGCALDILAGLAVFLGGALGKAQGLEARAIECVVGVTYIFGAAGFQMWIRYKARFDTENDFFDPTRHVSEKAPPAPPEQGRDAKDEKS